MMQKSAVASILLALILTAIQYTDGRQVHCRQKHTVSRCVDGKIKNGTEPWCSFHMCGPSFVSAKACPAGRKQATHRCKVLTGRRRTWVCISRMDVKPFTLPLGCVGNGCRKEVIGCRCRRRLNENRRRFVVVRSIPTPACTSSRG